MCYLCGRVNDMGGHRITGMSLHQSLHAATIMKTILDEANAGALTTKGQAKDRLYELLDIDRWAAIKQAVIPEAAARVGRVERLQQPSIGSDAHHGNPLGSDASATTSQGRGMAWIR